MDRGEFKEFMELKEINEYRGVKEPECVLKAHKPSLNSLNSLISLSSYPKARKPSLTSLISLNSLHFFLSQMSYNNKGLCTHRPLPFVEPSEARYLSAITR